MKRSTFLNGRPVRALSSRLAPLGIVLPLAAHAELPELEEPSAGTGNGILDTLQNYGADIVMLVALLVISAIFVGVCYHAYSTYSEIHTGRKTWGEFGLTVAVGALILVLAIWLLTKATEVLGT